MASPLDFAKMFIGQLSGSQALQRTAEPSEVTAATENVVQYDQVMSTKLAIAYAAGLETVCRARASTVGGTAMDLACGPGHYTLCLAQFLGYAETVGIDLSPGMGEVAGRNAAEKGLQGQV